MKKLWLVLFVFCVLFSSVEAQEHKVVEGESLLKIASLYNCDYRLIKRIVDNAILEITNKNFILPGWNLEIPETNQKSLREEVIPEPEKQPIKPVEVQQSLPTGKWLECEVKKGETLSFLAKKYTGNWRNWEKFERKGKPLGKKSLIYPGDLVQIDIALCLPIYQSKQDVLSSERLGEDIETIKTKDAPRVAPVINFSPIKRKISRKTLSLKQLADHNLSKERIKKEIEKLFEDHSDTAIMVFYGESNLNSKLIGDHHLSFWSNGERLGRSVGIAQIRTGGKGIYGIWNRARDYGLTVATFEKALQNPYFNLKVAKDVFEKAKKVKGNGFLAWTAYKNKTYLRHKQSS